MSNTNLSKPIIGVGVLVWREKQLLLGKRISQKQKPCWQFPGGHLENNESVVQCAVREVAEETGLTVSGVRHLGFTDKSFSVAQSKYITLFVSCNYATGEAQTLEPDKCEIWRWFDCQDLPVPLFRPIELFLLQQDEYQHRGLYELHLASKLVTSI